VLARLDKIEGLERTLANRGGTLVRVTAAATADPTKVADEAARVLTEEGRDPVGLTGDELRQALAEQEWHGPEELSAIEFRTLALRRVRAFAEAEKLDPETTERLVKIAEEEWDRLAGGGPPKAGTDWERRCADFAAALVERAKTVLTAEQAERLRRECEQQLGRLRGRSERRGRG
jgi:hypothetical protein